MVFALGKSYEKPNDLSPTVRLIFRAIEPKPKKQCSPYNTKNRTLLAERVEVGVEFRACGWQPGLGNSIGYLCE